ncbi:MAG: DNA replication/repair protein RecF [Rickettsiales bacterium]|nr:DNA replication/repair protein RecF [Pseudomonadota bacterium]MDA0966751.1 DNA replication/repair protein RecF [Pseudomonadota bacterium]MDG4543423.1 DNA replication/repair protein RecF [Rickettsiales bacterium]MDG4546183.1 DNA replication/repair protein RecF [Rickettsiales bacterium]MDG4547656.1 DNA replication/repair protein RecF [Rickettsiales bacterium]
MSVVADTPLITDNIQAEAFYASSIKLGSYRNYKDLSLKLNASPVVLTGANGSGKTNILEAISLLSPGKGFRKIKLNEADMIQGGEAVLPWSISAVVNKGFEEFRIGTGRELVTDSKRIVKIDGDIVKNQAELTSIFSVMWLTPQMDGLFIGSSSDRRKFLDRLVYNFDPEHASRIYSYEYTMRERAKIIRQPSYDPSWVSVLEEKMAQRAVSIAAARIDTVEHIQAVISEFKTAFPKADIDVQGGVERIMLENSALQAEEILKKQLYESRGMDTRTGRTSVGTHRSDFIAFHNEKAMPAASCSTGEQKALLLSIILAEARAKALWKGSVPVLLLDEVVAHLDEKRRASLFEEIFSMQAQVWMTGTDEELFKEIRDKAQFFNVYDGVVTKK